MPLFLSACLALLVSLTSFAAEPVNECAEFAEPVTWRFCVTKTAGSESKGILYILHGGGGGDLEEMRSDTSAGLRAQWANDGVKDAPVIVQVSFGPMWALTPRDASPASGLYDVFVKLVMPLIEGDVLHIAQPNRMIWGHSMGGLNASILAMRSPELFVKVAMTSPAPISGVSPFAGAEEIAAYRAKSQIAEDGVEVMLSQYRFFMAGPETFDAISIVASGSLYLGALTPKLYVSGSPADTYYYYGIRELVGVLERAKVDFVWKELPGGHGAIDGPSLSRFLTL